MKARSIWRRLGVLFVVLLCGVHFGAAEAVLATKGEPKVTFGKPWSIFDTSVDVRGTGGSQPNVRGMKAVFDVTFTNLPNTDVMLMVCFYTRNKNGAYQPLPAYHDIYYTPAGYPYRSGADQACAPYKLRVPNTSQHAQLPLEVGMPYDELHLPRGQHVLYYQVAAFDMRSVWEVGRSSMVRFTMNVR